MKILYSTITSTSLGLSASDGEEGASVTSSSSSSSSSPSSTGLLGATGLLLWSLSFLLFLLLFFRRPSEGSLDRGRWMLWEEWRWSADTTNQKAPPEVCLLWKPGCTYTRCPPHGSCAVAHRVLQQQGWGSAGSDGHPKPCSGHHHLLHHGVQSHAVMRWWVHLAATERRKCDYFSKTQYTLIDTWTRN